MNLPTSIRGILEENAIISQDIENGIAAIIIVGFLPNLSTPIPEIGQPHKAPS